MTGFPWLGASAADVTGYHGLEYVVLEEVPQIRLHLPRQRHPFIEHRQQHAFDLAPG